MPNTRAEHSSPRPWSMLLLVALMLTVSTPSRLQAADPTPGPSAGARGMCGAMGTIELKPLDWIGNPDHPNPEGPTTWWLDTDGIDPGTAGCHLGLTAPEGGKLNGRLFGEACIDDNLLVESNPGAGVVHAHGNDLGHPDTFDCTMWCRGKGHATGRCEAVPAYPCEKSARCTCSEAP